MRWSTLFVVAALAALALAAALGVSQLWVPVYVGFSVPMFVLMIPAVVFLGILIRLHPRPDVSQPLKSVAVAIAVVGVSWVGIVMGLMTPILFGITLGAFGLAILLTPPRTQARLVAIIMAGGLSFLLVTIGWFY